MVRERSQSMTQSFKIQGFQTPPPSVTFARPHCITFNFVSPPLRAARRGSAALDKHSLDNVIFDHPRPILTFPSWFSAKLVFIVPRWRPLAGYSAFFYNYSKILKWRNWDITIDIIIIQNKYKISAKLLLAEFVSYTIMNNSFW